MFTATHFTYDGVFSGEYGLVLANFDNNPVVETMTFSPEIKATKTSLSNRFFVSGLSYEEMPSHTITVLSESEIPDVMRRKILSWLVGRNEFKKLTIHQSDLTEYYYNCIFTDTEIIYINGRCHGFRLTALFDSCYARSKPTVVSVPGSFTKDTAPQGSGAYNLTIYNKSDIKDGYTYPTVTFSSCSSEAVDQNATNWAVSMRYPGYNVCIYNDTDNPYRPFVFAGLISSDLVVVDNELCTIKSSLGGEKLSNFNKNWLRLRPGVNNLRIYASGNVEIKCPTYAMIGF